ncbi:MAG: hypothetical protein NUV57_04100 [archaeon]|nr:hypothetical protein [archaeon]
MPTITPSKMIDALNNVVTSYEENITRVNIKMAPIHEEMQRYRARLQQLRRKLRRKGLGDEGEEIALQEELKQFREKLAQSRKKFITLKREAIALEKQFENARIILQQHHTAMRRIQPHNTERRK